MLFKIINCVLVVCFLCGSCEQKPIASVYPYQALNSSEFKDSLSLAEDGEIRFPIDSLTPLTTHSLEIFTDHDQHRYLAMLNENRGIIDIYDYDSRQAFKRILPYYQGPNGIGNPEYCSFHIINWDSIIICDKWSGQIHLIGGNAKILRTVSLEMPHGVLQVTGPDPSTERPMFIAGSRLYIPGRLFDLNVRDNSRVLSAIGVDMQSGKEYRWLPRPALYNQGTWSDMQYELYMTYNSDLHEIVYSFSADPYVFGTDLQGRPLYQRYLGSKYFDTISPYLREKKFDKDVNFHELLGANFLHPLYNKIIFDPFHKVYYRTTLLPLTRNEYEDPQKRVSRKESIIISDTGFKKIGEVMLPPRQYNTKMIFVTKEGLVIAKSPENQEDENHISFTTFKLVKK
jgi:Domain of unknown function (DUF4221)